MEFPWLAVVGIVVVAEAAEPAGTVAVVEPAGIAAEAALEVCCYYYRP
jgi:hypothetical protein